MNLNLSTKPHQKLIPVKSLDNLRQRLERLLSPSAKERRTSRQIPLDLQHTFRPEELITRPTASIIEFLDFLTDSLPDGELYLFGGVLRDLALVGARGFSSDIDLVVEGDWAECTKYLDRIGAQRNKFGGYRTEIGGWEIDIWNAKETWAIREGLVEYKSILSLTETTVLNWDAILMNWRTKSFVCKHDYLEQTQARVLDIVLEKNPDPEGMAVRVFRHLCAKDAKSLTPRAVAYLADCTSSFSFQELAARELKSYGKSIISPAFYRFCIHLKENERLDMGRRIDLAGRLTKNELGAIPQFELNP